MIKDVNKVKGDMIEYILLYIKQIKGKNFNKDQQPAAVSVAESSSK
jgi:hypothetical protein